MTSPRSRRTELIECSDCCRPVSFRARWCPHCGSREPHGPYVHNRRELRNHRIEYRNDKQLLVTVALTAAGAFYGAVMAPSVFWSIVKATGYGTLGLIMGPPVAFVLRLFRR